MERRRAIIIAVTLVCLAVVAGVAIMLSRGGHPKTASQPTAPPGPPAASPTAPQAGPLDGVPAVITPKELADAHKAIRDYLVAIGTYTYRDNAATWASHARALTDGSKRMTDQTSLPTGRSWADCVHTQCSSTATANLIRDTVVSNAPVDGAARSVTTLASTTVTLNQGQVATQTNEFAVTATYTSGEWKISGLQLANVGNAGDTEDN